MDKRSDLNLDLTIDTLNYLSGLGIINWTPGLNNDQLSFEGLHKKRYGIAIEKTNKSAIKYYLEKYNRMGGASVRISTLGQVVGLEYFRGIGWNMNYIIFNEN